MKSKGLTAVLLAILLLGASVLYLNSDLEDEEKPSGESKTSDTDDDSDIVLGNISSFDDAVNSFSFDLFKKFMEDASNTGNIFYSPYSVFTALAMTYEGAKGETAEEMANVLGIEQDNESFHNYMKNLYDYLNKDDADYNISTANALWVNQGLELLEEYIKIIQDFYGGESTNVDFSNAAEAAEIINTWVEEQTNNLIKDLVPESALGPLTRLVLTNAIYFKGTWEIQFDEANTTDRAFTLSSGEDVDVSTMSLIGAENMFNYTETDDLQILELPYTGNEMSMMIILPKGNTDLSTVVESIDKESYYEWLDSMTKNEVNIYLPKFEIKTPLYDLNNYLIDLGMEKAFGGADFSGITTQADLFISKVLHKAFIEVNEEGTEAAAATAVIMFETAYPGGSEPSRIVFDCDHPFLFLIQHKETKTILFIGSMDDPRS